MKAPRFTLDQLRPGLQAQVVAVLHGAPAGKYKEAEAAIDNVIIDAAVHGKLPKPPKAKRVLVKRTRNAGTLTEAGYWGMLRSSLRRTFRFWKPALKALKAARVPYRRGQLKWAYLCADCGKLYRREGVQIDHVEPCGALTSLEHVGEFIRRLTPEDPAAFRVRCLRCHQAKTTSEREARPTP